MINPNDYIFHLEHVVRAEHVKNYPEERVEQLVNGEMAGHLGMAAITAVPPKYVTSPELDRAYRMSVVVMPVDALQSLLNEQDEKIREEMESEFKKRNKRAMGRSGAPA